MFKDDPSWRLWLEIDPKKAAFGMAGGLLALAVFLHVVMFKTEKFNWLDGARVAPYPAQAIPPAVT
jgi:hypothetical protein